MSWAETQVGLSALSPPQVPGTDGPPGASAPVGASCNVKGVSVFKDIKQNQVLFSF